MISTNIFTTDNFPVPNEWIFEKLLNLSEKLQGQTVKIKSVFNAKDKDPSFVIYYHSSGKYMFKDFSADISGDGVELVQQLYNLDSREKAFAKAYSLWKLDENYITPKTVFEKPIYEVTSYVERNWDTNDKKYWGEHRISSNTLESFNVKPLQSYTLTVTKGNTSKTLKFENAYCYGYFTKNGTLYKIYKPKDKSNKFLKIKSYVQGHDQLQYKAQWLMILSSLKDCMAFKELGFPIEFVAPESENVDIPENIMKFYKRKYKFVTSLFDNDIAGKTSSIRYKEKYKIEPIFFDVEKDLAECLKQHGKQNTKLFLKPLLVDAKNRKTTSV